jgi:hypothetical protein
MFPDSDLAKTMSCGETKSMYLSCFGIAPYFKSLVEKTTKTNPYVVMFDESLNKELQKKQIDILIRTWHTRHSFCKIRIRKHLLKCKYHMLIRVKRVI